MIATLVLAGIISDSPSIHRPDTVPLYDSGRMVSMIGHTSFSLQYATTTPCETRVEYREGGRLDAVSHAPSNYRVTPRGAGLTLWHSIDITDLKPGTRYYYRIYDPGAVPTNSESEWGALTPWSREYAVSTEAPVGRKTIIHLPVKVLLMPNVVNAESAVQPDGSTAPDPAKMTPAQISLIENEYRLASRVFWMNSGMRLWVDFQFFVDDRWQRWGPSATGASAFFQNLPQCRSYGGADYVQPGGGTFTFVDTTNPTKESKTPVEDAFACQVEQAWPRRWDPVLKVWKFYVSGGGTFGVDDLPHGIPARTQFLAGGDTAWLAEHELHHQLESLGAFCLGNSEDDRIVFDHPSPRHRNARGDGTFNEQAWTTTGPHGEQWDVMRFWDTQVTDCQWLRFAFGTTETVVDKDGDGFPDNDPRLPLDAKRFKAFLGTSSYSVATNWDWVVLPLQSSWIKDRSGPTVGMPKDLNWIRGYKDPNAPAWFRAASNTSWGSSTSPRHGDDDAVVVPFHAPLDANASAWSSVPVSGHIQLPNVDISYKQGYDSAGYYGLITAKGPVDHIDIDLDGEGKGMFTPPGAIGFTVTNLKPAAGQAGPVDLPVSVKVTAGAAQGRAPWLTWKANRAADGSLTFAFRIPNGSDGPWYWQGAGHEIGVAVNAYDASGHGYSMGEPYRLNYCRMVESRGRAAISATPPSALDAEEKIIKFGVSPSAFTFATGIAVADGVPIRQKGTPLLLGMNRLKINDFDLTVIVSGQGDFTMGAYADQTPNVLPDRDYSLTLERDRASLQLFGNVEDGQSVHLGPGTHKLQMIRRAKGVWTLIDGKVVASAPDPNSRVTLTKIGIRLAPDTDMMVQEFRYRILTDPERSRQP